MPLPSEQSAGERAYRVIRHRIVTMDLKPNQAIGEQHLAASLGMSRTPIREALMRLAGEGLVDFRSRAGTIVSPIRVGAVKSAQFVREKLEVAIIEEATASLSARFKFKIQQTIDEQRFAIEDNDIALFFASDERMHQSFSEMTGRPAVWSVISEAKKHMDRVRWLSLESTDLNLLLADHVELQSALEAGDASRAHTAMKIHLRRLLEDLDRLIELNPGYFDLQPQTESEQL